MAKIKNKQIQELHKSTKRDYIGRMNDSKIESMIIAKKFAKDYWDGDRKYGYGGYKYIPDRNLEMAKKLIIKYKLNNNSKILDIGCGKGYLLYEISKLLPKARLFGLDISKYAIKKSKKEISKFITHHDIRNKTKFKNNYFDLVISINTLHNLKINELFKSIKEIDRISIHSLIVVESYRNEKELFNLQCWALTCQSFYANDEWKWIFAYLGYKKDFDFIFFE